MSEWLLAKSCKHISSREESASFLENVSKLEFSSKCLSRIRAIHLVKDEPFDW